MNIGNYQRQLSEYMKYKRYSQNSIDNYVSCIGKFLTYFENEATKPSEISAEKIKRFLAGKTHANTHKAYLSAIKLFYDKVGNQPQKLDKLEYPKLAKNLPIVLSTDEIQGMFNVCKNLKHKVIISLIYSCGLRVSELINLQWKHLDRSRKIINIIAAKGNKDRQVALPDAIVPLLENYYRKEHSEVYVLNGQFGLQYSATSVLNVVKDLASKAGIRKRVYTHLLRHCTFTHMAENGTDINLIQKIAGHSNVKTTMIYCHLSDSLISKIQSPINNIRL
jgi:site-specific recombinase XerD